MCNAIVDSLYQILDDCTLCPRQCHVNRRAGELGYCGAGIHLKVAKAIPHFGEEPPISGIKGSGTIFFSHCNLRCRFCQNYQISQLGMGQEMTSDELCEKMLLLQDSGCHNINLVTPTPFLPQIVKSILQAKEGGLKIPIVYNTNGYERTRILRVLEGIVDIYLPDAKYGSNEAAIRHSNAADYLQFNESALKEMKRQVGDLIINEAGIAKRGIIVRHLILPDDLAESVAVIERLSYMLGTDTYISLMGQYFPMYRAFESKQLSRRITCDEFDKYCLVIESKGFENGWIQYPDEIDGGFLPDFEVKDQWN
ncbi:MAG: radical SAM protein [Thermodesulfobacteriota bacterium]|nr:radical SAM protein [Thermodesulfobacteriota bacterium]